MDSESDINNENILAKKNSSGYTPAHIAVKKLKLGLLEALIEAGAPVDIPDNNGETPLLTALHMDDTDMASLLVQVYFFITKSMIHIKEFQFFHIDFSLHANNENF